MPGGMSGLFEGTIGAKRYKPTRADQIRRMSDEELADRLVRYEGTDIEPTRFGGHHHYFFGPDGTECKTRNDAVKAWLDWLRQPAEENNDG